MTKILLETKIKIIKIAYAVLNRRNENLIEAEAYRALSSKSRLEILKLLYRKQMSVEEIAEKLALQPITIRHHLQSLVEAGFIETVEERAGSVGRPKIFYKMVKEPPLVSYPKRRYLMLNNFVINTLRLVFGENETQKVARKAGLEMGKSTAKKLESDNEVREWSLKAFEQFFVKDYLEKTGAEPEIIEINDKKIVYRLHNCLFFEMALKMPEIMCDNMHDSFHEGLITIMGKDMKVNRLTCMGKGDLYCEHSCELLE
jgi:predicted ArsR family transcriptional regulator